MNIINILGETSFMEKSEGEVGGPTLRTWGEGACRGSARSGSPRAGRPTGRIFGSIDKNDNNSMGNNFIYVLFMI